MSDIHRNVSSLYQVLIPEQGIAARATFIIDKEGIIRYQAVNDLAIRRNVDEILRIVEAMVDKS